MVKAVVAGAAGGIGQPLSLLLKTSPLIDTLALYDVVNSPGVAADLSHVSTEGDVKGFLPENNGLSEALKDADIVLIPAGIPRKPGMTRDELFKINAGIVAGIAEGIAESAPKAFVLVISNPVNSTVPIVAEVMKRHNVFDARRIFGVTTLDTVRAKTFIGGLTNTDPKKVSIPVIGGHSGNTIVPLLSKASPSVGSLSESAKKDLIHRVQFGGDEVVQAKAGAGSATLSMAYAGFLFAEFVLKGAKGEKSETVSYVYLPGIPGGEEVQNLVGVDYFAVPVSFGKNGAESVANPVSGLPSNEAELVKTAVSGLKENIQKALDFTSIPTAR